MDSMDSRKTARLLLYPMVVVFVAALSFYLYSLPALQGDSGETPGEANAVISDGNFSLSRLSVEAAEYSDENAPFAASDGNFSLSVQEISVKEAAPREKAQQ